METQSHCTNLKIETGNKNYCTNLNIKICTEKTLESADYIQQQATYRQKQCSGVAHRCWCHYPWQHHLHNTSHFAMMQASLLCLQAIAGCQLENLAMHVLRSNVYNNLTTPAKYAVRSITAPQATHVTGMLDWFALANYKCCQKDGASKGDAAFLWLSNSLEKIVHND